MLLETPGSLSGKRRKFNSLITKSTKNTINIVQKSKALERTLVLKWYSSRAS
jgi:hypothetical protein